jgi:hypothetical protein
MKRSTRRLRPEAPPLSDPAALRLRRRLKRGEAPDRAELLGFGEDPAAVMNLLRVILVNEWVLPEDERLLGRAAQAAALLDPAAGADLLVKLRVQPGGGDDTLATIDEAIVACGPAAHDVIAERLRADGDRADVLEALAVPLAALHATHPDPRTLPVIAALRERSHAIGDILAIVSRDPELRGLVLRDLLALQITEDTPEQRLFDLIGVVSFMKAADADPPATLLLRAQLAEAMLRQRVGGEAEDGGIES